jgi:hypothetical protein
MRKEILMIGIAAMLLLTLPIGASAASNVSRDLPAGDQAPSTTITVELDITVDSATFYAIDEVVPTGWTVTSATDGGNYTGQAGHVKWVVIDGATDKTYSYTVEIPSNASGTYPFDGIFMMNTMAGNETITGDTEVNVVSGGPEEPNVCRDLPAGTQAPGSTFTVELDVTVGNASFYAIDEIVPENWTVTSATGDGNYTAQEGHVKWVVIDNATDTTYSYTVEIPGDANGTYPFDGIFMMNTMAGNETITGDTEVNVGEVESSVCRDLPEGNQTAGSTITVELDVTTGSADYYTIDETVPAGWTVTSATGGGNYTAQAGHVKWIVISGATDTTYSYTVEIPCAANGTYTFDGIFMMEGMGSNETICGDTQVTVTEEEPVPDELCLFIGWNFVSVPSTLENPCFVDILDGLPVDCVMYYDPCGNDYAGKWYSTMSTWYPLKGYWIHATANCSIPGDRLTPEVLAAPAHLHLYEGWNGIGHCDSTDTLPASIALQSFNDSYLYVMGPWDPLTETYTQCGYNGYSGVISGKHMGTDVFQMSPYEGYWVYVTETCIYSPVGY